MKLNQFANCLILFVYNHNKLKVNFRSMKYWMVCAANQKEMKYGKALYLIKHPSLHIFCLFMFFYWFWFWFDVEEFKFTVVLVICGTCRNLTSRDQAR